MNKEEVEKLVKLRKYTIEAYKSLGSIEARRSSTSVTKTEDVAYTFSSIVKSLDEVLKDHVKFE